jgi:hypothetical protein
MVKRGVNNGHFKVISTFNRISYEHGGTCIYVKEQEQAKEQNCLQ